MRLFRLSAFLGAAGLLAGISHPSLASQPDPQLAAAQTLLHQEQLYEGSITGILDPQTESAIRHYQIIHGFRVTGQLDSRTRSAMALPEPALPVPENVIQQDRKFLRQAAAPSPPPVAEPPQNEPAATPSPTAPSPKQTSHHDRTKRNHHRRRTNPDD